MNIMLDTHILLWALSDSSRLPQKARDLIEDNKNEIFYSVVSLWEIEIKRNIHPDSFAFSAETVADICDDAGYRMIELGETSVFCLSSLSRPETEPPHKDPFDRMLVCQAISENMMFLTHDSLIKGYNSDNIIFV